MSDAIVGLIRTVIPAAVGTLVGVLTAWGITIDAGTETALATGAVGVATGIWWFIGRLIEQHLPGQWKLFAIPFIGVPKSDGPTYG